MRHVPGTSMLSRRSAAVLVSLGLVLAAPDGHAIASTSQSARSKAPPRVLFIGDSILDQQGSAAAFVLRQSGVDAEALGVWESGLLTVDQYDYGKTKRSGFWFRKAKNAIADFDPDVVGVYMNHNYWPPFPHDAAGNTITDLRSAAAQRMIGQQARALITILRARHAKVFFVSPIPAGAIKNPNPSAWNPIWHGYLPVLRAMHVAIADSAKPLERADGLRAETKASCYGSQQRVRPPAHDVHLTRFGAGLAGTALANYAAGLVHANLRGNTAPGDTTAALVPAHDRRGYWLVGCDGSVYHFGDAPHMDGARRAIASHRGVAAAVATPTGAGLWLIASDGKIVSVGDAPRLAFTGRPNVPITDAAAVPGENGIWATTGSGVVLHAGSAVAYGGLAGVHLAAKITGIAPTHDGHGYWLVGSNGSVRAFGHARAYGSVAHPNKLEGPIVGIAATADDHGYWLVSTNGSVHAFGRARLHGTAVWHRRPGNVDVATPGPASGVVTTGETTQSYWIFGTTGRVSALGAARRFGGDNNLAIGTQ